MLRIRRDYLNRAFIEPHVLGTVAGWQVSQSWQRVV